MLGKQLADRDWCAAGGGGEGRHDRGAAPLQRHQLRQRVALRQEPGARQPRDKPGSTTPPTGADVIFS